MLLTFLQVDMKVFVWNSCYYVTFYWAEGVPSTSPLKRYQCSILYLYYLRVFNGTFYKKPVHRTWRLKLLLNPTLSTYWVRYLLNSSVFGIIFISSDHNSALHWLGLITWVLFVLRLIISCNVNNSQLMRNQMPIVTYTQVILIKD